MKEQDEIWLIAYSIAAAAITIGTTVSGRVVEPENIDRLAKELANRAEKTVMERAAGPAKKGK